jgi:hypothetical protein
MQVAKSRNTREPFLSTGVCCISLALRLCRQMCGKAVPYRLALSINWRLCLPGSRRSLSPKSILHSSEGHSPSAHQAAEPQEKPLVSSCVDTNGAGIPACAPRSALARTISTGSVSDLVGHSIPRTLNYMRRPSLGPRASRGPRQSSSAGVPCLPAMSGLARIDQAVLPLKLAQSTQRSL